MRHHGPRILIVSATDSRSGAGLFRHALTLALRRSGYAVVVAQPEEHSPIQVEETAQGIEHHFFSRNPYHDIAAFAQDRALAAAELRRTAPDFVVFNSDVSPACHYSFLEAVERERIPYNSALRHRGLRALEIGCWLGWSAAHLAAAGVEVDVVDPLLAEPDVQASVVASLRHAGLAARVRLLPGNSPGKVFDLARLEQRSWSLIFIDSNHDRPHPLIDAKAATRVAAEGALIRSYRVSGIS